MAIERRVTALAGEAGGRLHTARSRNDQVATDVAMFVRAHAGRGRRAHRGGHARADRRRPRPTRTGRCPATRTSSAPSRSTWPTTCSPTCGCSPATAQRFQAVGVAAAARMPLGAGALAGVNFDTDRGDGRRGARLRRAGRELDRRRLQPRLRPRLPVRRGDLRDPPLPARRRDRPVVLRGVRLLRRRRRLGLGLVDHAAEEEPRRGRAAAGQGAADRRPPRRLSTASCTACR